jgi:hypothetical protein
MRSEDTFSCAVDRLRIGNQLIRINDRDLQAIISAQHDNLLAPNFIERATKGITRTDALNELIVAMRKCMAPPTEPLVDLLVLLINQRTQATSPAKKQQQITGSPKRHGIGPPRQGITKAGLLHRDGGR